MVRANKDTKNLIYKMYYNQGLSIRQIRDTLSGYCEEFYSKSTIERVLKEFNDEPDREIQPRVQQERSRASEELVLGAFYADPCQSCRNVGKSVGYSECRVRQILHKYKFKPYKLQSHQELLDNDEERRNTFCEIMLQKTVGNDNFLKNICFTDESTFYLHTQPNKQNSRVWSNSNPHKFVSTHSQKSKKVNIWAGILNHHIIGPFIIEGTLNGEKYLELLQEQIIPRIREVAIVDNVWYQHDGCPSHFVRPVTNLLNETFPNRWIGRGGAVHWPPRSPDLSPNDFFLWPYISNKVFTATSKYNLIQEVANSILQVSNRIDARILANVRKEFFERLSHCLIQNGGLFEHLLKK